MSTARPATSSPVGLHRVLEPSGEQVTLPQTARRLDASPQLWPDEVRIDIETLNLDAASYRQLATKHTGADGTVDGAAVRMTSGRLKRHMRGDLERIIQHALHADPNRRYAGVAALADDVEALLDGRPVVARPDSWTYRVRRFIGRHRAATAATVVSVAALVTVAVGATLQSRRVAEERDRATAEERRAAAVIDLMAQVLGQTDPRNGQGLTTVSIDELLSHAESLVPSLSPQSDVQGRMLQALGSIRFVRGERPAGLALLERGLSATAALDLTHPVRVGLLIDYADALAKSGRAGVATPLLEPLVAQK